MEPKIRPAKTEDLEMILKITNHAILHTTALYDYEARTWEAHQKWYENKITANFPVLVADLNGKAIGFGTYGTFREKPAYHPTVEHSVYVDPEHTGHGIGKILLQALIATAKAQNYHLMIGCIDAANATSIAFHKNFGFTSCGTITEVAHKFDRWLDLEIMQLKLQ